MSLLVALAYSSVKKVAPTHSRLRLDLQGVCNSATLPWQPRKYCPSLRTIKAPYSCADSAYRLAFTQLLLLSLVPIYNGVQEGFDFLAAENSSHIV